MARLCALVFAASLAPSLALGQTVGTFRWQLQSYCNVLSLVVTQNGGVFTLDGFDDQCGATTRAPVTGLATFNPNGTVEFGLTIVATPDAAPVHVAAAISVATLGGTWRDSAGNTGNFVFTPGPGTGGTPRPAPTNGIAPGSVGSAHIDPAQVQRRVTDSCSVGSFVTSIGEDGSVACGFDAGDISRVTAGPGLAGGGQSGSVEVRLPTADSGAFHFHNINGFVAIGPVNTGNIPYSGAGTRVMWYPGKAAFRAGSVDGLQWNDASTGSASAAFGENTEAKGTWSTALGVNARALGNASLAAGFNTVAEGAGSFVMGYHSYAGGDQSIALGSQAIASTSAHGSFVFADRSPSLFASLGPDEFNVRASGGVRLYTSADLSTGCTLPAGSGTWACASDRNSKERFEPVDGELVLTELRAMPIERWSYRNEPGVAHVGPVAQDFHAAFGLGADDKTIGHLDLSGISLRAIQALEARTRALIEENAALRKRLERIEAKGQ